MFTAQAERSAPAAEARTPLRDVPSEVALAWELRAQGRSVRYISEALSCSISTAHARVKAARQAEGWTEPLDIQAARVAQAEQLDQWAAMGRDEIDHGQPWKEIMPILLRIAERKARLLGLDMPARVQITDDRERPAIDPEVVAAVQATKAASDARVRAIQTGDDE